MNKTPLYNDFIEMKTLFILLILLYVCCAEQMIDDPSFEKTLPDGVSEYWQSFYNPSFYSPFCNDENETECPTITGIPGAHTGHWYFWFAGYGFRRSITQLWYYLPHWTCGYLMRVSFWITIMSTGENQSSLRCIVGKTPIISFSQSDTDKYANYTMVEKFFWMEDCYQASNSLLFVNEGYENENVNLTHYFMDDVTIDIYY
jgi:hypothetical protein